jgi:hypothetical protein
MRFSITSALLLAAAALGTALPASSPLEKRQNRNVRITPTALTRLYEHSPDLVTGQDGWGETSSVRISAQTASIDAGLTCIAERNWACNRR